MQRIVKPTTRAGKRFLQGREPKLIENDKKTLFIRGVNANNVVVQLLKDVCSLKKPNAVFFNRKNDMKPMEDATTLEFFCQKSDASLFMFGSHNKKRPNNLIAGRMHNAHVLDIFEFGVEDFKSIKDFKTAKIATATKPMLLFTDGFEESPELTRIKNFFIDFFRGPVVEFINLKGLEHLLVFSVLGDKIRFRSYKVSLKKELDSKSPGVNLEEIGPHMDLTLRRSNLASDDYFKQSLRTPKAIKPKKQKNMSKDVFGTSHGRIHMERQDYAKLNQKKMKGLKKRKFEADEKNNDHTSSPTKKAKLVEQEA